MTQTKSTKQTCAFGFQPDPRQINARYRLELTKVPYSGPMPDFPLNYDVIDRALELQFLPAIIFSNGTEAECREWVLRNCEEPVEHTKGPWKRKSKGLTSVVDSKGRVIADWSTDILCNRERNANAALISTAPKLLALLEQYHQSFPSKESGKLICEARNWTIQE